MADVLRVNGKVHYKCIGCGRDFENYKVLHDYIQIGDDDYDDLYVCPYCRSEDFKTIIDEE